MSSTRAPDFSQLAAKYDVVRPVDANWWEVYDLVERLADLRGRRVLDVGCGTGRLSVALAGRAGAKVWGVDASPEMLAVARAKAPPGAAFKEARAESLPFKDGWFERVVLWLVVHLVDRGAAHVEARRVLAPGGRVAVVSFDPSHFDSYWLNEYMPSLEEIDRARFPTGEELVSELTSAGFVDVETVRIDQRATLTRADALLKLRAQHISTLQLVDRDEYERGVAEAERTLPDAVAVDLHWLVVTGTAA
jgi:ubiquinone/menaquinone biosynthesis C-methylase UbiE